MSSRYKDFDAAMAEQERKNTPAPITFKWCDVLYTLPTELPAIVAVIALRAKKESGEASELSNTDALACIEALLGKVQFDQLLATGITTESLIEILKWGCEQYSENPTSEEANNEEGNPEAPA